MKQNWNRLKEQRIFKIDINKKVSVTKESGNLTQAAGINCYWDKSLITFNPKKRLSTLQRSYEDPLNAFKVFPHFKQIFSLAKTL